ncbi:MAG: carbohydrate binding family 9 domain-containing protein [Prolixibacteraceae bacterium]|nr:carbohydrate binding family 9 domain-containing protein [Prolixibacteraceae bacterium]
MATKPVFFSLFLIFFAFVTQAQIHERKTVTAIRIDKPLKIDGILDEEVYSVARPAKDFLQLNPHNGQPSYQPSEVRVFYDDNAIYFGAMLYENPDSIRNYITTRDNIGVSDYFGICIDPNNEGLTAYEFIVTPANSQTDLKAVKREGYDNEDSNWDAVWQSATKITHNGWCAELQIPYSALRFPQQEDRVWGINFFRRLRRYNSHNSWNFVDAEIAGFIQQSGELHGLKNIKSPVRLSITPFVAGYVEVNNDGSEPNLLFKGGMDLKYGISESHTLDMMLIPDFGQIQSDDKVLNLTPYETYYDEKRQFFVEGIELFERADIFYSRRIGGTPKFNDLSDKLKENESVTYNPTEAQIINATKVSGRDKKGWGIGFLNAMTLQSEAEITDTITGEKRNFVTQPFTNYNVTVIEKSLPNNSYMSVINTNLSMAGNPYLANVAGIEFQFKNKKQTYLISGSGALSYKSIEEKQTGFKYELGLRKVKGKFRFMLETEVNSDTYAPNDLGYLQRNNDIENQLNLSYNIHEPFWIFKTWYAETQFENTRLYNPNEQMGNEWYVWTSGKFKNNMWTGMFFAYNWPRNDYFVTRVNSRYYTIPAHISGEINFETDSNRKLSFNGNYGFYQATQYPNMHGFWSYGNLWWKASQRFSISYNINTNQDRNGYDYATHYNADSIFFGFVDVHALTNTLSLSYYFDTKISVDFRARHYWSWIEFKDYYFLNNDGNLSDYPLNPGNDHRNVNIFNIDMAFKWEFAPGSELSLVWKNSVYKEDNLIDQTFFENIENMFTATQTNNLSLKILYYIDYNSLRKK